MGKITETEIPKLPIPVFTNLGFQCFNLHVYIERVRKMIPDLPPNNALIIHDYLEKMHKAFDDFDLKKFKKLQNMINSRLYREMIRADDRGVVITGDIMRNYFTELKLLIQSMRSKETPRMITNR